ncbi:Adenylylsulfate kinase [Nakaseomyces glabratus]
MTNHKLKVIVLAGTAGTGKSTVAARLLKEYSAKYPGIKFVEGDELHPKANIDKMASGNPLNDDDRWGWLKEVALKSAQSAEEGGCGVSVVACSSLKKSYRDLIRSTRPDVEYHFVFLYGSKVEILNRLNSRKGHFMKSNMMESQFKDLQLPEESEANCVVVLLDHKGFDEIEDDVLKYTNTVL